MRTRLSRHGCWIPTPTVMALVMLFASVRAQELVWTDADGPWTSGPAGSWHGYFSGQPNPSNSFMVVGESPVEIEWRFWGSASGSAVCGQSPWWTMEVYFWAIGWLQEDDADRVILWEHRETWGPAPACDVPIGGTVSPITTHFTAYPGRRYTLTQENLSELNFFDLGDGGGWVESSVGIRPIAVEATTWGAVKQLFR